MQAKGIGFHDSVFQVGICFMELKGTSITLSIYCLKWTLRILNLSYTKHYFPFKASVNAFSELEEDTSRL